MAMVTVKRHHLNGVFLPEELVTDILLRLPVKSILRFTAVRRLWRTIIRSQRFIRDQVRRQESNTTAGFLMYCQAYEGVPRSVIPKANLQVYEKLHSQMFSDAKLQLCQELESGMLPGWISSMRGPINGILCLRKDNRFLFWNPATGNLRTVPACPSGEFGGITDFGFGINPLTGVLKIVLINRYCYDKQFAALYDSGDDSWSLFEDRTLSAPSPGFCVLTSTEYSSHFSNGFCYWIIWHDETGQIAILAFDMRYNSFQEIEIPIDKLNPYDHIKLDTYNDTLALVTYNIIASTGRVETWLLEKKGCWAKLSSAVLPFKIYEPIGILNRNEIFVSDDFYRLVIYDTDSCCTRKLECNRVGGFGNMFVRLYKATLASV